MHVHVLMSALKFTMQTESDYLSFHCALYDFVHVVVVVCFELCPFLCGYSRVLVRGTSIVEKLVFVSVWYR